MEFAFDERQREFRAQLRAFAEKECTPADLRAAWDSELGWSPTRWQALADMGVVGLRVPEAFGGLGLDEVDLVLLLEEAGRAGLPEPLVETVALGAPLLAEAPGEAGEAARGRWLAGVAAGETVLTVATSSAPGVSAVPGAHVLLLEHRGALHAVETGAVGHEPLASVDGARRLARVTWEPSPATVLATGAPGQVLLARTSDRAAMATASVLIGVAERLITMATAYAVERQQFGRAIGSFQAVKHHLADALIRLEFARPVVYRAAWSIAERSPTASRDASMAKAHASDAATLAARSALQVHGAIGYTWEHDLHLWMKRAWALAPAWGDAAEHRARVLEGLMEEGSSP